MFRDWIYRNFQIAPRDNAAKHRSQEEMGAYHDELLDATPGREPEDDLLTPITHVEIDGEPVATELKVGYVVCRSSRASTRPGA